MASLTQIAPGIDKFVDKVVASPEVFFQAAPTIKDQAVEITKQLYDFAKQHEPKPMGPLSQLLVDGFDDEQIWEELQLQNEPMLKYLDRQVKKLLKKAEKVQLFEKDPEELMEAAKKRKRAAEEEEEEEEEEADDDEEDVVFGANNGRAEESDSDAAMDDTLDEEQWRKLKRATDRDDEEDGEEDIHDTNGLDGEGEEEEEDEKPTKKGKNGKVEKKSKKGKSSVEDQFFKLDDMEAFLQDAENEDAMQRRGGKKPKKTEDDEEDDEDDMEDMDVDDINGLDAGADQDGDEEEEDEEEEEEDVGAMKYGDFFDSLEGQDVEGDDQEDAIFDDEDEREEGEEIEEEEEEEAKGTEGKKALEPEEFISNRRRKLEKMIGELEEQNLANIKPWEMKGEVGSKGRPVNSLLETNLDVQMASKAAPLITEEVSANLEDVIKRRILDQTFDDVIPKKAPRARKEKEVVELDFDKAKKGLGEEYEEIYNKQILGVEDSDPRKQLKDDITMLFQKLCYSLDSLSNFHFTPKPVIEDLTVKANVPAINMEESIPLAVSEASRKAPEEIYAAKRREVKGESELTQEERKRQRAAFKRTNKKKHTEKEEAKMLEQKLNPKLKEREPTDLKKMEKGGVKVTDATSKSKGNNNKNGETIKFSKSANFFKNLQESTTTPQADASAKKEKKKENAKRLKL